MDTNKSNADFNKRNQGHDDNSAPQRHDPSASKPHGMQDSPQGYDSEDTDKYLAMEQPGVTFTPDTNAPLLNSDNIEDGIPEGQDLWDGQKPNNRNSEAFNQDEFLLEDNLDLDDDSSKSISSDD